MIVPVPPFQHSPMFGHCASSHTVLSLSSRSPSLSCVYLVSDVGGGGAGTRNQSGRVRPERSCSRRDAGIWSPRSVTSTFGVSPSTRSASDHCFRGTAPGIAVPTSRACSSRNDCGAIPAVPHIAAAELTLCSPSPVPALMRHACAPRCVRRLAIPRGNPHGIPGTYPAHPETSSAATSAAHRRPAPNNTIATDARLSRR
mmetsp:Transcript_22896/g.54731  ORF Transcript_22896/g.54731 Transcript_22896/m.54731 type:complete len:200 (+) Transcript_22896:969-1568(+)